MSVLVEAAPRHLRDGDWSTERERLGDITVKALERYAPGSRRAGRGTAGDHARGPRERLRPERRARLPRRTRLDQFFMWRPLNGQARYRFVLDGLYLAGSGAHPGRRRHRWSRRERRAADPEGPEVGRLSPTHGSSLVIVPSPMPEPAMVALVGLERFTEYVSFGSLTKSPAICTMMVFVVSPGLNVTVPLTET